MTLPAIILASSSRSRKALLSQLFNDFDCVAPDVDETPLANETPLALAGRLSELKAKTVARAYPEAIVIAGDQTAECQQQLLGKPLTRAKAISQLQFCSGQQVKFHAGLCVIYKAKVQVAVEPFSVMFRKLDVDIVKHYVAADQPLHSAGAFKAESLGISLFEAMTGNDYNALIGLPLIRLTDMLLKLGFNPLSWAVE